MAGRVCRDGNVLYLVVSQARFRLREVFDCLAAAEVWKYGYGQRFRLSKVAMAAIQWWVDAF